MSVNISCVCYFKVGGFGGALAAILWCHTLVVHIHRRSPNELPCDTPSVRLPSELKKGWKKKLQECLPGEFEICVKCVANVRELAAETCNYSDIVTKYARLYVFTHNSREYQQSELLNNIYCNAMLRNVHRFTINCHKLVNIATDLTNDK